MLAFAQWIQSTLFFTELRGSAYVYPIILVLHMVALAVFGGLIFITDMRLLGFAAKQWSVSEVVGKLRPLKHAGFMLMVTCGILMACCKAEEYYYNVFFQIKMGLLVLVGVHALAFRGSVYRNTEEIDRAPRIPTIAKLAASISLVLWLCLVICGRGIGYIEPPLDKIHAGGFLRNPLNPTVMTGVTPSKSGHGNKSPRMTVIAEQRP